MPSSFLDLTPSLLSCRLPLGKVVTLEPCYGGQFAQTMVPWPPPPHLCTGKSAEDWS